MMPPQVPRLPLLRLLVDELEELELEFGLNSAVR